MRYLVALSLPYVIPYFCQAQTTTKGTCSPIISGGANNQFTFYCEGISAEQGKQLLTILNQIARDQLNPRLVMKTLDEIKVLAARGTVSPDDLATGVTKGLEAFAKEQQQQFNNPRSVAQRLYLTLENFLDMRQRADMSAREQARQAQQRSQQIMTRANVPADFYDNATLDAYHNIGLARGVNSIKELRSRNLPVTDLLEISENIKTAADLQRLADHFKELADPRAQRTYEELVDFLDSRRRLQDNTQNRQKAAATNLTLEQFGYSHEGIEKQTVDIFHDAYTLQVSNGLEQLRSQKVNVDNLAETSRHVNSVDDIRQLTEGFKKLADALPSH